MPDKEKQENNNFVIFKDRTESLLKRWEDFAKRRPDYNQGLIVRMCCQEIDDEFTRQLKEETK